MPDDKAMEKWKKQREKIDQAKSDHDSLNDQFKKSPDHFKNSTKGKQFEKNLQKAADKVGLAISKLERLEKEGIFDMQDEAGDTVSGDISHLGDAKRYDDASFKKAFNDSVQNWAQDARIALNTAHSYMISMSSPDGLKGMDVFDALALAIPHPAVKGALSTAKTIITLLKATYNSGLPSNPDVNDIHQRLDDAFRKVESSTHDDAFEAFWKDWSKKQKIEVEDVWSNIFLPACEDYAKDYLGTDKQIAKAFLKECVDAVEDDDSFLSDLDDVAGIAYIELTELVGNYSDPRGYLDDVPKEMVASVKQVWKNEWVIDLPFELYFSIRNTAGGSGTELAVIKRKSTTPGNDKFKLAEGDPDIYDSFLKKKAYNIPKVSHLKVD